VAGAGAAAAILLVLLEAVVAVLVVDLAGFFVGEGVVGVGDGDELLLCGFVAGVLVGVVLFAEGAVGFFDVTFAGFAVDAEELVVLVVRDKRT